MYHESEPGWAGYPTLNVFMAKFDPGWEGYPVWQSGLSALAGHPTYHVNVIKLKWEITWTGGLPHPPVFNFLSNDQLTKKKDRTLIKDVTSPN